MFEDDISISRGNEIHSISLGTVSSVEDPEELGRVKVKIPWLGDNYETDWTPVVVPVAGKSSGFFFLPAVNEEVVIAFRGGDINYPYVLGSVWTDDMKPPVGYQEAKENDFLFKSRKGHLLTFNDEKESIEIRATSGHKVALNKEKIEVTDKGGNNFLRIDVSKGNIEISSGSNLSLKAPNIMIQASKSLEISSSQQAQIKAANLTAESSANFDIRGALVKIN